jgi:hypothetical protein
VIDKWFRIGVQLGLSESKLRQIRADYDTVDMRFSEVIGFWLNGNASVAVCWKSLVEVLESPFVGEKGLAKGLREKGGMIISKTGATESGVQPQEINGGQRGKKRSVQEKLDDGGDQQPECQGTCTSNNIMFVCYSRNSITIMYYG